MKRFVTSFLLISAIIWGVSLGVDIPVQPSTGVKSCNANETENVYYYLPVEGLSVSDISDTFGNTVDSLIGGGSNGSSIDIWRNGVISQCNTWNRVSNVVSAQDSNGALIFLNTDTCVFGIPNYTKENNGNMIDAQIHYTVGYRKIYNGGPNTLTDTLLYYRDKGVNNWTCYPNGNTVSDFNNCQKTTVKYGDQKYHTGECINYRVFRCGDGLVNRPNGSTSYNNGTYSEACDPESSERKNRSDGKRCNSSCQIEEDETPVCSSEYNGKKVYTSSSTPYLNGTETLCNPGTTRNFQPSGTPIKFTWGCKNGVKTTTSDACKFRQYRCGDGEINGGGDRSNFINGSHYEECDPNHSDWKGNNKPEGQSCTSSCTIKYETSTCGSLSSTTAVYNQNYPTWRIKETDSGLCGVGKYVTGSLSYNSETGKYTWKCQNGDASPASCSAQDLRCGDKIKNGSEQCDKNDPSRQGWEEGTWKTCNQSCQLENIPREGPVCSSTYSGHTEYTSTSTPWISSTTPGLCSKGTLVPGSFTSNGQPRSFSWKCTNDGLEVRCTAKQQWCGDTVRNGQEVCDYNDTTHNNRGDGCSTTCDKKTYDSAKCGSTYHTKSTYLDINSSWINSTTPGLCDKGNVINFNKHTDGSSHVYTWQCKNGDNISDQCWADQQWCGDGTKNGLEQCDKNDPSRQGWEEGTWKTCNESCKLENITRVNPVCNSTYNGKTKYTTTSDPWLKEGDNLCTVGTLVSGTFKYSGEPRDFTWACTNDGLVANCEAHQQWCGDSERNNNETCDPKDPNEVYWGNDGCDETCQPRNVSSSGCDETFYYTLRHGREYTFHDTFNANSATRYLYDFDVDFVEEKDYNRGANPSFNWTESLVNGVYMEVPAGTSKKVLISSPLYQILDHPTVRSKNNLYIEYDVKWSNQVYSTKPDNSRLRSHKECAYYEISWCGDGKIDTEWEGKRDVDEPEQCDPGSAGTSVLPNGKICNSECKIVDAAPNGTTKIEKTLKENIAVTKTGQVLTWIVEVTAEGGDATDFEVKDYLPKVLDYLTSSVVSNPDNLTVTGPGNPVLSGSNYVYTRDVKGTLRKGHKLRMEIKSKVNTLVKVADKYLNIACVVDDGKEDCDDAKPNPEEGKLEIVKTLVSGDISAIGDPVVWNIRVTATGGDVTDFVITDKLPDLLGYSGYTVTHKGSVDSITFGGENKQENSVSRNVLGTLNNGDYVEIRLVTKAKKIPTEEYVNVACVKSETNPEVCSEVPVGLLKITKTLLTNKYVETGDIVKWEIKVEAIGGNVGIDYIYDDLPRELGFTGYSMSHIPSNITLGEAEIQMGGRKRIRWAVSGILHAGDYITLIVETEVLKVSEDEVKNIACVKPANQNEPKCDDAKITEKPNIWIRKVFEEDGSKEKIINTNDKYLTYRISFGNSGNDVAKIFIKDFLPKNVEKVESSSCFINGVEVNIGKTQNVGSENITTISNYTTLVQNVMIDRYTQITLNPGDYGYIILVVKLKDNKERISNKDNRTNFACIYYEGDTRPVECDDAKYDIIEKDIECKKLSRDPSGDLSSNGGTKHVVCHSSGKAESIKINCGNGAFLTGSNISELSGNCKYPENLSNEDKPYKITCEVDGKTNNNCIENFSVKGRFGPGPSCFPAGTEVTMADGSKKNIEDVEIGDIVLSYNTDTNTNEGNVVQQTFVHTDNIHEMYELTIDGNILKVTDIHPFYVRKSLKSNNYNWIEAKDLKVGDMLLMNNGSLAKIENMNHYNNKETVYNLEVEGNHNYYVGKGYLVHNKTPGNKTPWCEEHELDPICLIADDKCSKVNAGDISIEKKEILPLYLGAQEGFNGSMKGEYKYIWNTYSVCEPGEVDLKSIKCEYRIKDSSGVFYTGAEVNCFTTKEPKKGNYENLILGRWKRQIEKYHMNINSYKYKSNDGVTYYPNITFTETNNWKNKNLGEMQLQISVTRFKQCFPDDGWVEIEYNGAVCQSNFVLTDSYTVQKTPSGNLTASTEQLEKFKEVDGTTVKSFSSYLANIDTTSYNSNNKVKTAMNKFIDKYEKLAVEVNTERFGNGSVKVKKVPGKNIYFLSGNATIQLHGDKAITNPFTIVQTNGDTTINGSGDYNMMLLTKGNIIFSGDCTSNQVVKGIFYAQGNLERANKQKMHNIRFDNEKWCDKGGLQIKGVLIGDNFDHLMKDSRSHLEGWFDEGNKAKIISNGASVLIEYSPSVFTKSTMPPGAEEFTTALSIYKN